MTDVSRNVNELEKFVQALIMSGDIYKPEVKENELNALILPDIKASTLRDAAMQLVEAFQNSGHKSQITVAVKLLERAVELMPAQDAAKIDALTSLGTSYQLRFDRLGELGDIEKAIVAKKKAADLAPDDHAARPALLNNLGNAYQTCFRYLKRQSDIDSAIEAQKQAIRLTASNHAATAIRLKNLGTSYRLRFDVLGDLSDIACAISTLEQAVGLTPDGHANKAHWLNSLGAAYQSQFVYLGNLSDIGEAVGAYKQAIDLLPQSHPERASWLNNLGIAYQMRFQHLGNIDDLESAITFQKQALELTPYDHARKASMLNNLGNVYQLRFSFYVQVTDIDCAIAAHKSAVALTPDDHGAKANRLHNLGCAYERRFNRLEELVDIQSAIVAHKKAIELTPDGHHGKAGLLGALGTSLHSQFTRLSNLSDLEAAISAQRQALDLTPNDHALKPKLLNCLSTGYQSRFSSLGDLADIDHAIKLQKQAIDLTLDSQAYKANLLNPNDIKSAIMAQKQAVELTPEAHADKATYWNILAHSYVDQFHHSQDRFHSDCAIAAFQKASLQPHGRPHIQFAASMLWGNLCTIPSLSLPAYKRFFELLPQVAWLGQTIKDRYKEISLIGSFINAAVAAAISVKDFPLAFEWLEEGRGVIWGQILQLRSPLDDLCNLHPIVAQELETVSCALEDAGIALKDDVMNSSEVERGSLEEQSQEHHAMAVKFENLVEKVRSFDGFGSFLKPQKFSDLAHAARHGPVIVVNVHDTRCDALVLCTAGEIIHVPLPKFSLKQAQKLHVELISSLHANDVRTDRNGDSTMRLGLQKQGQLVDHFASILGALWSNVVQPILAHTEDILYEYACDSIPHITWCTTRPLTFLPLHAAGIYKGPKESLINVSDFAVSSYTTTLQALMRHKLPHQGKTPSILIVSQPETPGHTPLPGAMKEATVIQKHTSENNTFHLAHNAATVQAVIGAMSKYDFTHFACHGIQDPKEPLESAFALYDQKLKLKALMSLSLSNVQLAVLSACQTASGDENLPEEAIHLAAGMLAVGYPSVIATLWAIADQDAPLIADKVYSRLMGNLSEANITPAYALHHATRELREVIGDMNFVRWVPFVHFGE